jgi:hypothetical protein
LTDAGKHRYTNFLAHLWTCFAGWLSAYSWCR